MRFRRLSVLLVFVLASAPAVRAWADAPPAGAATEASASGQSPSTPAQQGEGEGEGEGDADARARQLYLEGDRSYAQGDYGAAIAAFQEAFELSGRPLLLFNLANAHERAGHHAEAAEALRRYLPSSPPHERASLERRIENLEARSRPAPPQPEVAPAAEQPASPPEPAPAGEPSEPSPAPTVVDTGGDSTLGWALTIAGGALLVAGAAAGVVALNARAEADESCAAGLCERAARDAIDRDQDASLLADIGLLAGAASLTTGLLLLLVFDGEDAAEHATLQLDARSARLGYRGTF